MTYFIMEASPKTKKINELVADSLTEVLHALSTHSAVAWVRRQITGAAKFGGRFIKFGWAGCSDLLDMMKDCRLLAVECKRTESGQLSNDQANFITMVKQFGGCAFVATSALDVFVNLEAGHD